MILVISMLVFGTLCGVWANWKGRNVGIAVVLGALLGIFALIGYMIAGESEAKKTERIKRAMQS